MNNLLITGGAGFIGSKMVDLLYNTYKITVLDNLDPQIHGENPALESLREKARLVVADIRDASAVEQAVSSSDYILHLAAQTGTGQSMYMIKEYTDVNCMGTSILMEAVLKHKTNIKKVIVASSRAVYGEGKYSCEEHGVQYPSARDDKQLAVGKFNPTCGTCGKELSPEPTDEECPVKPLSVYGLSKYYQEELVKITCQAAQIPYVGLRFQNVYGAGQSLKNPYTGILSIFSTLLLANQKINIFEDGYESRDFIYVDDICEGIMACLENSAADNQILNLGSGKATSVIEVVNLLAAAYQKDADFFISGNYRIGDIRHNYANMHKALKTLNFTAKISLEEGIKRLAEWVLEQNPPAVDYQKSMDEMRAKNLYK